MANRLYDKGREAFANGDIDWLADNIKFVLIDTADYTVNTATHDFLDDVPSAARVATSGNLAGKTSVDGVCDADDVVLTSVTGDSCEAGIIYQDTGTAATSHLIVYIDTATGLPITPNGANITIAWDNTAGVKIFKL